MSLSVSDPRRLGNRRWWALGAVSLSVLVIGLDGTVLSVALPTLARSLHASESDLQWFSSSYLLVLAAAMLPAGLLGDRFGRKKVMLISLALFALGSVACAAAPSSGAFIAARVLLGIAGAGVIVMAVSALTVLFDERERPKAVGVWAAANFLAIPIGPILGGWLLTHYWWGWVFLMNVPVTVLGLGVASALVPESRAARTPGLDLVGTVASVAGLLAMTYGLIEAGQHGWGKPGALVPMLGGMIVIAAFLAWERRLGRQDGGQPLLDLRLFDSPSFTWGVILAAIAVLAMIGVLFTMPQYFQGVVGTDAMGSGIRLLPVIGGLIAGALPADRLARHVGAKLVVAVGFGLIGAGLLIGSGMAVGSSDAFVAIWMAIVGLGMGLTTATASSAALSQLSEEHSGVGSAVLQAVNKTGGPFGTAILGSVLTSAYLAHLQLSGLPDAAAHTVRESVFGGIAIAQQAHSQALLDSVRMAFVHGIDRALIVSAAIAFGGAVLAILFLPGSRLHNASERDRVGKDDVVVRTLST
jgi:MFS transporter, DHA2 family, multidrug resistance protein